MVPRSLLLPKPACLPAGYVSSLHGSAFSPLQVRGPGRRITAAAAPCTSSLPPLQRVATGDVVLGVMAAAKNGTWTVSSTLAKGAAPPSVLNVRIAAAATAAGWIRRELSSAAHCSTRRLRAALHGATRTARCAHSSSSSSSVPPPGPSSHAPPLACAPTPLQVLEAYGVTTVCSLYPPTGSENVSGIALVYDFAPAPVQVRSSSRAAG